LGIPNPHIEGASSGICARFDPLAGAEGFIEFSRGLANAVVSIVSRGHQHVSSVNFGDRVVGRTYTLGEATAYAETSLAGSGVGISLGRACLASEVCTFGAKVFAFSATAKVGEIGSENDAAVANSPVEHEVYSDAAEVFRLFDLVDTGQTGLELLNKALEG